MGTSGQGSIAAVGATGTQAPALPGLTAHTTLRATKHNAYIRAADRASNEDLLWLSTACLPVLM